MERLKQLLDNPGDRVLNRSAVIRTNGRLDTRDVHTHTLDDYRRAGFNLAIEFLEKAERDMRLNAKLYGKTLGFNLLEEGDVNVQIGRYNSEEWMDEYNPGLIDIIKRHPRFRTRPIYSLLLFNNGNTLLQPSPYGMLPGSVADLTGTIYDLRSNYIFDEEGNGARVESVQVLVGPEEAKDLFDSDDPAVFWDQVSGDNGQDQVKPYSVPFRMSEEDSRLVELTPEDHVFVQKVLTVLEGKDVLEDQVFLAV